MDRRPLAGRDGYRGHDGLLLIREVLQHCLEASTLLDQDAEQRPAWEAILRDLPPFQIGKHGQLQEWYEDFEEREVDHRHYSHLIGVYPGDLMTQSRLPAFNDAARVALQRRVDAGSSIYGMTAAWTAALWARFGEGDRAYTHLQQLICEMSTLSLLNYSHGDRFQIDANLAGTAAYPELFLQSHDARIEILPALPSAWPTGSITGLRARGNFTVDITWQDGAWTEARITSHAGEPCRVAGAATVVEITGVEENGGHEVATQTLAGDITWHTIAGQSFLLRPEARNSRRQQ